MPPATRPFRILLVDDNAGDRNLFRLTFRELGVPVTLSEVEDGDEALDYLARRGEHEQSLVPDLVLLDLSMPRTDGHEVLRRMKQDPALRRIPVIIVSSTLDPLDVERCYDAGANAMIVKPLDYDGFVQVCEAIHRFWTGIVTLTGTSVGLRRTRHWTPASVSKAPKPERRKRPRSSLPPPAS